jgi:hypothetical protein
MDLVNLAEKIEEFLAENAKEFERMGNLDADGCAWGFAMEDPSVAGFLSCESNQEDLGFATVSLALSMMDGSSRTRDEMVRLMQINTAFYNAALVATPPDSNGNFGVMLARKIPAEQFQLDDLVPHIRNMLGQAEMFLFRRSGHVN